MRELRLAAAGLNDLLSDDIGFLRQRFSRTRRHRRTAEARACAGRKANADVVVPDDGDAVPGEVLVPAGVIAVIVRVDEVFHGLRRNRLDSGPDLVRERRELPVDHDDAVGADGDTWVYFADANVLCTGDTMNNLKRYQSIDYGNGGDIRGMIRAADTYLRVANDQTKIVVGHGPLASKADVAEFRQMLVTSRDRIEKLVNEGKTEEEVVALKPLADLDATWAKDNPQLAISHTRNVYNSFKRL